MGLKAAATSLHLSQSSVPPSPSSAQTLASAVSSPSSIRCCISSGNGALSCRYGERSAYLNTRQSSKLHRSRSCYNLRSRIPTIRRASSACLNSFFDGEFSKNIQDLALRFQSSDEDTSSDSILIDPHGKTASSSPDNLKRFDALERPEFLERDEINPADIERKANSAGIPLSLRMIKKKKQWEEGFMEAGQTVYCSVKKAFSSMVFIIRELHSYTMQMRQHLFYEDLRGILERVQNEMHESFVWLFQQVFSHTPTLMVYVMILLANYSVYSMSNNAAIAVTQVHTYAAITEAVSVEDQSGFNQKFESSSFRTVKSYSSNGKTTSVGGNNGGGGRYRLVASGTDGDGRFDESTYQPTIVPQEVSSSKNPSMTSGEETVSSEVSREEEETSLWNSIVDEASVLQSVSRIEVLDHETMLRFVSPVDAKIEDEDHADFFRTELQYQAGLAQDPKNPLLLANYAQFLYLVVHEFDRAEDYFKRATKAEPKDAEAWNKYANFLWLVRKDLWAAEETYLEAISAEPENSYYAANYAHFLWNTGGEDTCFPLDSSESSIEQQ